MDKLLIYGPSAIDGIISLINVIKNVVTKVKDIQAQSGKSRLEQDVRNQMVVVQSTITDWHDALSPKSMQLVFPDVNNPADIPNWVYFCSQYIDTFKHWFDENVHTPIVNMKLTCNNNLVRAKTNPNSEYPTLNLDYLSHKDDPLLKAEAIKLALALDSFKNYLNVKDVLKKTDQHLNVGDLKESHVNSLLMTDNKLRALISNITPCKYISLFNDALPSQDVITVDNGSVVGPSYMINLPKPELNTHIRDGSLNIWYWPFNFRVSSLGLGLLWEHSRNITSLVHGWNPSELETFSFTMTMNSPIDELYHWFLAMSWFVGFDSVACQLDAPFSFIAHFVVWETVDDKVSIYKITSIPISVKQSSLSGGVAVSFELCIPLDPKYKWYVALQAGEGYDDVPVKLGPVISLENTRIKGVWSQKSGVPFNKICYFDVNNDLTYLNRYDTQYADIIALGGCSPSYDIDPNVSLTELWFNKVRPYEGEFEEMLTQMLGYCKLHSPQIDIEQKYAYYLGDKGLISLAPISNWITVDSPFAGMKAATIKMLMTALLDDFLTFANAQNKSSEVSEFINDIYSDSSRIMLSKWKYGIRKQPSVTKQHVVIQTKRGKALPGTPFPDPDVSKSKK